MPARVERIGQGAADEPGRAGQQDPHGVRTLLSRALVSGTLASVASTLVASLLGERRTASYASSTNATSHWVWGDEAKFCRCADVPHTLVGYAIHHGCSVFWATGYEALMAARRPPHPVLGAGAVALVAYVVDYHVIPRRLTPGFEGHMRGRDMLATYGAFAAGLAAAAWLRRRREPGD